MKKFYSTRNYREISDNERYDYFICANCNIIFLNNAKKNNLELYKESYHSYPGLREKNQIIKIFSSFGFFARIKIITKYKKCGNLLDIGCATGEFLEAIMKKGTWELFGIEPNNSARELCLQKKLDVFSNLFEANFPNDHFDVITLWDVIEHIDNPREFLSEIGRIMKIGGLLVIKTPDPFSIEAKIFNSFWSGIEAPWHLFLFSKPLLIEMLSKHSFSNFLYYQPNIDYHTFYRSINNFLIDKRKFTISNIFQNLYKFYPFKLLFNLFLRLIRFFKFNSSITISAIKME